jgi:hypothetical protein
MMRLLIQLLVQAFIISIACAWNLSDGVLPGPKRARAGSIRHDDDQWPAMADAQCTAMTAIAGIQRPAIAAIADVRSPARIFLTFVMRLMTARARAARVEGWTCLRGR